jgi:hypothetical protein
MSREYQPEGVFIPMWEYRQILADLNELDRLRDEAEEQFQRNLEYMKYSTSGARVTEVIALAEAIAR